MKFKYLIILGATVATVACKFIRKDDERAPIARVFDTYLYADEIGGLTNGMSADDSTTFVQSYINNWGKEQLLIKRAEFNLRAEQKDFEDLVRQYRNDLLKFAFLEKYVNENIDTLITEKQINSYYETHQSDFELKENILKVNYYIIPTNAPDLKKAKDWWRVPNEKNDEKFLEYASIFARVKNVGDTNWVRFEDLARTIPLQTYNQQEFLNRNKRVMLEDAESTYFVDIVEHKIKDDASPLAYVQNTIISIILNKRKLELIAKMEEKLVDDAFNKKDFEIY